MAGFPWRALRRRAAAGAVAALVLLVGGRLFARAVFGGDHAAARARVEADVRSAFDQMERRLEALAARLADPQLVRLASDGDVGAMRRLFAAAADAVASDAAADAAVTVYDADGLPLAWAGRPSELPLDRLLGGEAWFFARGALTLRLVHVRPVVGDDGIRLGSVAAERGLGAAALRTEGAAASLQGPPVDTFQFPTRLAPVAIRLPVDGAADDTGEATFDIASPTGTPLLTASVADAALDATRARWERTARSLALVALAIALVVMTGPVLGWRSRTAARADYAAATLLVAAIVLAARFILRLASPADWSDARVFSASTYVSPLLRPLLTSPFDFLLTAMTAGALVALVLYAVEQWRVAMHAVRRGVEGGGARARYLAMQLAAGAGLAIVLQGHDALLRDTIANTALDLLHFSLSPWDEARVALQVGLVIAHAAAVALSVAIIRAAAAPWRVRRSDWRLRLGAAACWAAPPVAWRLAVGVDAGTQLPLVAPLAAAILLALAATRLKARYRHGSQAFRLTLLTVGLAVPAMAFYPVLVQLAHQAKVQLVETRYAPQALNQRRTVLMQLQQSLAEIDALPGLIDLVTAPPVPGSEAFTDRAFQVWQATSLASYPVTSSVELYDAGERLVSRFAFNLPEDPSAGPLSDEGSCTWDVYEEVAPFFAEERRILHAGRALCTADGRRALGSIVVHAMLDYENLPFISSQSPYVELLRPRDHLRGEGLTGRDVEYAVYGWSRTPLYTSGDPAWPLPDEVFARVEQSRAPIWAELERGSTTYDVLLLNDRGGIYALGFPQMSALEHLVSLAELTVVAAGTYLLLLAGHVLLGSIERRRLSAPALLREIRASFYRKLFLAFVLAVFLPVVALAVVTRNYVADEIRLNIEQEAVRTASAAVRVVEDLVAPRAAQQGVMVDDNLMVWVSRLIDQDVNIFAGARLLATSERNLFASGLLPTRTPAEVYHALRLRNEASIVTRERIGTFEYLVAGAPINVRQGVLTVPLASRQQEIDEEIETLDRRVLLAALLFILAGAGLGYTMAERIADPVNRLSRATRRIARGDLDLRIAATSTDELRRLVEDFNSMAAELKHQRKELERTNRLEAWAEMARQVAHEIKNPLTPIQLNAEYLRRVHADRGQPLSPVLEECVSTILAQVKLLRQIASEFSSFASSPDARPALVGVPELVHEIVDPYRRGLEGRIRFDIDVPEALPPVFIDRTLIARSLTNIVENALHAMPGAGTLVIVARAENEHVRLRISDTGVGMDPEALARAFEPYFSTKATGTGLGLPIAKRNVELNGGTISVTSARDRGTTVELTLPLARAAGGR